jgi:hypothetical protein
MESLAQIVRTERRQREVDPLLEKLVMREEENRGIALSNKENISHLQESMTTVISTVDRLAGTVEKQQETIEPVVALMQDISSIAKVGRALKNFILWLAVIGGSIGGTLTYFSDIFKVVK